MRSVWVASLGSALALSFGCVQEPSSRPPWADQDCDGIGCGNAGPAPMGQVEIMEAGVDVDARALDAGALDAGDDTAARLVTVEPQQRIDLEATASEPLALLGDVYELTALAGTTWEQKLALAAGGSELSVSSSGQWFWFSQEATSQWLASVQFVAATPSAVTIPVFAKQFFDDMAAGLANFPVALNGALGHVVLRVTDADGVPLPSVSAEVVSGVIAYGVGGTASDFQMETGETGTIVWLNAKTGGATTLVLNYQAQTQSVALPVLPASVTLGVVALNLQMP